MAFRTASYAEAKRNAERTDPDGGSSSYRGTSAKSQAFFRKMGESHAEAERLRQQCRATAYQSTARNGEVKVNLQGPGLEQEIVEQAKAIASFSTGSTLKAVADCKQAVHDHEASCRELFQLEQARTKALAMKQLDEVPLPQLDSSAAEQAEEHARGRVKDERGKLAQAGLDSLWHTTNEAPHGRFLKLEHLSLPQDLKKKWREQEENEKLVVSSSAPPPVSQIGSLSSDVQADKTPSGHLANEVYAFITDQEASETQTTSKTASEVLAQASLNGSLVEKMQMQEPAMNLDNPGTTANETTTPQASSARENGEREQPQESPNFGNNDSSEDDDSDDEEEESEESDMWPPSPPMLRFKMRMQFSNRFKPTDPEQKALFESMNQDLEDRFREAHPTFMKDPVLGWLNLVFHMSIETEYQFEVGFPLIMLTMLDAIYPKRVRWREVDWRFQYKRALQKNYAVVETIWAEVNMEKAREFRVENTSLRMENLPTSNTAEKLEFLRLMKRWYDQRIHHSGPYDPMAKRREFVEQCKSWGHAVKFPVWIKYDKDHKAQVPDRSEAHKEYEKMPEYKRLIWFLGCQEYQTM